VSAVPCPQYSREHREHSDCLLIQDAPRDDEKRVEINTEDVWCREWCLALEREYRRCPVF
jgi:hypothetical protein